MKGPPRETAGGLFMWRAVVELDAGSWLVAFLEYQRSFGVPGPHLGTDSGSLDAALIGLL